MNLNPSIHQIESNTKVQILSVDTITLISTSNKPPDFAKTAVPVVQNLALFAKNFFAQHLDNHGTRRTTRRSTRPRGQV
jgi:hypothetical protein